MNYDDMNNLRCGNPDMSSSSGQEENQSLRCQGNSTGDYSENRPTRLSGTDGATGLSR